MKDPFTQEWPPDGAQDAQVQKPQRIDWPDPSPEMAASPEFEAVWAVIKDWDIHVPGAYSGYCGATGSHVRAILDGLAKAKAPVFIPPGYLSQWAGEEPPPGWKWFKPAHMFGVTDPGHAITQQRLIEKL